MDDIVPGLLDQIRRSFRGNLAESKKAVALLVRLRDGAAAYRDAGDYAYEVGNALAAAFRDNLSAAVLPEGCMYWNIAQRVIAPLLQEDHTLVSAYASTVQTALNKAAGLGLQAQAAPLDQNRVDGILNKVSSAPNFDEVAWVLDEPIKTFSQSVVDDTLKANVEFQGRSGLYPKIIRTAESHCCEWCSRLEGVYEYPGVPKNVYRRHSRCRCVVEYDPGSGKRQGKRQDVWSKRWTSPEERAKIEERKRFSAAEQAAKPKPVKEKAATWNDASGSLSWPKTKRKAMYSAEYGTTRSRVEVSRLYASDGRQLFKKSGDVSSVAFTAKEIQQMRGGVLTHNHPGGGCFSPNDINMLRYGKLREIRAVTGEGVYRIQAPASWSRKISSLAKIDQAYYDIDATVSKDFFDRARAGEISYREADNLSQRAVVQILCKQYNIPFEFDSWDDIREMM